MSESGAESGDIFDLGRLRRLVELMEEHDLREIELKQGEQQIQLKRGAVVSPGASLPVAAPAPTQAAAPAPAAQAPAEDDGRFVYIESPMVGTFYSKANPESDPFVKVGDRVNAEMTVCIIEAMKVFNEIPAGCNGTVAAILVENEEPVEFGKKLFKIDTQS